MWIIEDVYLLAMVLNLSGPDGHGYDDDLDSDMLDCCYSSKYPHSVLTLAMHDHVPNRASIYYWNSNAFDMINAADTDDAVVAFDRIPFLFHDTYSDDAWQKNTHNKTDTNERKWQRG